jgi:hypothetical protein
MGMASVHYREQQGCGVKDYQFKDTAFGDPDPGVVHENLLDYYFNDNAGANDRSSPTT